MRACAPASSNSSPGIIGVSFPKISRCSGQPCQHEGAERHGGRTAELGNPPMALHDAHGPAPCPAMWQCGGAHCNAGQCAEGREAAVAGQLKAMGRTVEEGRTCRPVRLLRPGIFCWTNTSRPSTSTEAAIMGSDARDPTGRQNPPRRPPPAGPRRRQVRARPCAGRAWSAHSSAYGQHGGQMARR